MAGLHLNDTNELWGEKIQAWKQGQILLKIEHDMSLIAISTYSVLEKGIKWGEI